MFHYLPLTLKLDLVDKTKVTTFSSVTRKEKGKSEGRSNQDLAISDNQKLQEWREVQA